MEKKILIRDDGIVRILNDETIKALEESRTKNNQLPIFENIEDLAKNLDSKIGLEKSKIDNKGLPIRTNN